MSDIDRYSLRPGSWPWDHHHRTGAAADRALRLRRRRAVRQAIRRLVGHAGGR